MMTQTPPLAVSSRNELVDLELGVDVDAARRLVEQQDAGAGAPAICRSPTFCWLPPDSVRDRLAERRRLDRETLRRALEASAASLPRDRMDAREKRSSTGKVRFSATDRPSTRPLSRRSSGTRPKPKPDRVGRRADGDRLALERRSLPAVGPGDAEQAFQHFAAAGADQAGDAEHLAAVEIEADVARTGP